MANKKTKTVKKVTPKTAKSTTVEKDPHDIIMNFQNLLIDADNFPRATNDKSYEQFWLGLRKHGPEMLGITKAILSELEKSIKLLKQSQIKEAQGSIELDDLKLSMGSEGVDPDGADRTLRRK